MQLCRNHLAIIAMTKAVACSSCITEMSCFSRSSEVLILPTVANSSFHFSELLPRLYWPLSCGRIELEEYITPHVRMDLSPPILKVIPQSVGSPSCDWANILSCGANNRNSPMAEKYVNISSKY